MNQKNEAYSLIANLYILGRMFRNAELTKEHYGTDIELFPNEAYTLRIIAESQGINQKEISALMCWTKGATSVIIKSLIQKGLIISRKGTMDQRVDNLYPTEDGMKVYQTHLDYDKRYFEMFVRESGVPYEDFVKTNETLEKFLCFIRERKSRQTSNFT